MYGFRISHHHSADISQINASTTFAHTNVAITPITSHTHTRRRIQAPPPKRPLSPMVYACAPRVSTNCDVLSGPGYMYVLRRAKGNPTIGDPPPRWIARAQADASSLADINRARVLVNIILGLVCSSRRPNRAHARCWQTHRNVDGRMGMEMGAVGRRGGISSTHFDDSQRARATGIDIFLVRYRSVRVARGQWGVSSTHTRRTTRMRVCVFRDYAPRFLFFAA